MRACSKCGNRFPSHTRVCPGDGTTLDHVAPEPGTIVGGRYKLIEMLGETPFAIEVKPGETRTFELRLSGFQTTAVEVDGESSTDLTVRLGKAVASPPPKRQAKPPLSPGQPKRKLL